MQRESLLLFPYFFLPVPSSFANLWNVVRRINVTVIDRLHFIFLYLVSASNDTKCTEKDCKSRTTLSKELYPTDIIVSYSMFQPLLNCILNLSPSIMITAYLFTCSLISAPIISSRLLWFTISGLYYVSGGAQLFLIHNAALDRSKSGRCKTFATVRVYVHSRTRAPVKSVSISRVEAQKRSMVRQIDVLKTQRWWWSSNYCFQEDMKVDMNNYLRETCSKRGAHPLGYRSYLCIKFGKADKDRSSGTA